MLEKGSLNRLSAYHLSRKKGRAGEREKEIAKTDQTD